MESQPESHGLLGPALKLVIIVSSLGVASFVGFYLHPHLLPFLSDSIPELWSAAQGWLTAPILFLLLNLVVGTLYFSSSMLSRPDKLPENSPRSGTPAAMPTSTVTNDPIPEGRDASPVANSSVSSGGLRARIEKSKPFLRLVRSKSEQIPPLMTKAEASGSRLKKAGTFEAGAQGTRKPMVIVADPPEDESAPAQGHEEVDQKAEDFISRFYQKVKLQRLDSLLRNQQKQGT